MSDPVTELDSQIALIANRQPGYGQAFRQLRHHASMTQGQLGSRFNRSARCVGDWESENSWPPAGLLPKILTELGVDIDVISRHVAPPGNRVYMFEDALDLRWDLHLQEMPELMRELYNRARKGSDPAAKLLIEDYERTEGKINARASQAINVNTRAATTRQKWLSVGKRSKPNSEVQDDTTCSDKVPDNVATQDN